MRTFVYVDGFNLYNRRLKYKPQFKWLNIKALADRVLAAPMVVERVNYYTARVSGSIDSDAPRRQQAFLAALNTIPEIKITYGKFMYHDKWAALARPPDTRPSGYVWNTPLPDLVLIQKAEEKGSDVNLGSHLVRDAFTDAFDVAVVITNDTDLVEPMRIARREAGKTIGLLSPVIQHNQKGKWTAASPSLKAVADFTLYIHNAHLAASQFPDSIPGTTIRKPAAWV
jgi:uncharacterized LabA/DUF88 family protein